MSYLIFDLVILALLILFTLRGWRKGLLLSLCGLVVVIAAYFGAGFLADTLDDPLADALTPRLEATIQTALEKKAEELGPQSDLTGSDAVGVLEDMGGLYRWAAKHVEDALRATVAETIAQQATAAANAVALKLAHSVLFLLSFLLLTVLLTLLLHALDLVAKLPGLHFCNGLGGAILGLTKGVIILLVILALFQLLGKLPPEGELEKSYLLKYFVAFRPMSLL